MGFTTYLKGGFTTPYYYKGTPLTAEWEVSILCGYYSLVGQIMFHMVKVESDVASTARKLQHNMINLGGKHWKSMERVVGYIKGKIFMVFV